MLRECEILTLSDNKKYVVVSSILYKNKNYVYLIDQDDYSNFKICCYDEKSLKMIKDNNLINQLIELFNKKIVSNN